MLDEWLQRLQNTPCPKLQVVERNRTQWEYTEVTLPQKTTDDSLLLCLHSVLAHFYFVQECHPGVQFCKQSTLNDSAQFLHTFPVFLLLIFLGSSIRRERLWMPGYRGQPAVILIDPRYTRVKGIGIFGSSKAHAGTGVIPFCRVFSTECAAVALGRCTDCTSYPARNRYQPSRYLLPCLKCQGIWYQHWPSLVCALSK